MKLLSKLGFEVVDRVGVDLLDLMDGWSDEMKLISNKKYWVYKKNNVHLDLTAHTKE